jgi:LysR family glycine cleavage system transcriptional activator
MAAPVLIAQTSGFVCLGPPRAGATRVIADHLFFTCINILLAWSVYVSLLTGSLSFAQGAFMAVGCYASGYFTAKMGLPMLRDFRREFPDVLLDVSSSYVTGLPDQDLDVAIVFDRPSVDDRVTDLLWMVRVTPVCSPELAKLAEGKTLAEFLTEQDLLHVKLESEPRSLLWSLFATQLGLAANTEKGLAFDTAISAVQYAISGGGLALADVDMFADELADGRLVQPFPTVMEDGYGYYLKFHAEDLGDPVISHFRTWVLGRFGATAAKGSRLGPGATQQNEL